MLIVPGNVPEGDSSPYNTFTKEFSAVSCKDGCTKSVYVSNAIRTVKTCREIVGTNVGSNGVVHGETKCVGTKSVYDLRVGAVDDRVGDECVGVTYYKKLAKFS